MVDYINQYLGPLFEKENPGTTVRVVGTGPGDAGSQKVLERFEAQSKAGVKKWDTDVRRPREIRRTDGNGEVPRKLSRQNRQR